MSDFREKLRNPDCELCPLNEGAEFVCLLGSGPPRAKIMVVGEAPGGTEDDEGLPFVGSAGRLLDKSLKELGNLDRDDLYVTNVAKCRPPENRAPELKEIKACVSSYLLEEFKAVKPDFVLLLGNSALRGVIGKSGITKQAGSVFKVEVASGHWARIMPTIHPAAVLRNPKWTSTFKADITRFGNLVRGLDPSPQTRVKIVKNKRQLRWLLEQLAEATEISWDIETSNDPVEKPYVRTNFQDWHGEESHITSCCFSWEEGMAEVVPFHHPDTPWTNPEKVLSVFKDVMTREGVKYIGHNGKFDARWFHSKGIPVPQTFDTMLAAHMLDENQPKGLKPQSKVVLGANAYDVGEELKNAKNIPLKRLCTYNGKDTDYTLRLYHVQREQLKAEPRVARVFSKLMMPASEALVDIERTGVWVDPERWETRYIQACETRDKIHKFISQYAGWDINLNSPQQVGKLLFDVLKLPIIAKTKKGAPSTAEATLLRIADQHKVATALIKYRKWAKYVNTYLGPWKYEWMDSGGRIHSSYKLFGTVTGRLSGEGGIQQVPRDPFIRGVIGATPGWSFLQADYSQVELRIAAMLSGDKKMLGQYLRGEDIHMIRAMRMTGKPADQVSKEERKKAKAVNFGYIYSMGAKKFVSYAFDNYDLKITLEEAEADRRSFFEDYQSLRPWHARQRKLAQRYGRVQSPIGRIRHLPDIKSEDEKVRAEAERQAINSPVQSFASDLMLLSLVELHRNLDRKRCRIVGTVHDSILFEVKQGYEDEYAEIIKNQMEDMSLVKKKFATEVTVPIVADIEIGTHWGETKPWVRS